MMCGMPRASAVAIRATRIPARKPSSPLVKVARGRAGLSTGRGSQGLTNFGRYRSRLERRAIDADHRDVPVGKCGLRLVVEHFELDPHGLFTFELRLEAHPDRAAAADGIQKIRMRLDPRHPDAQPFEQLLAILEGPQVQLLLGLSDESKEVAEIDQSGRVA